jgi:hypothetical protein
MTEKKNQPIEDKEEIRKHPDRRIDQDFDGYPAGPAKDETIRPETKEEEKTADLGNKDGEKRIIRPDERGSIDEQDSDASANAFEGK